MSTQSDAYVGIVQAELVRILNDYIHLLIESNNNLHQSSNSSDGVLITNNIDRSENVEAIQQKIHDVVALQIRMPIVASMKAGKSTIIDAFIGGEFLPTRSEAMTAIPTAIILKLAQKIADTTGLPPRLILEDVTNNALQSILQTISEALKKNFQNDGDLDSLLKSSKHLVETAKLLRDSPTVEFIIQSKITDCVEVKQVLTFINDSIRIAIYLSSYEYNTNLSLDAFLKNIPAIQVNFEPFSDVQKNFKQPCQLILIDTPGPNEAAGNNQLRMFVKNELKKADVILAVVEYGHINTESDNQIAQEIKTIRELKDNQDCIYVLINKIDEHRPEDTPKDDLRKHVASTYGVPTNCVFFLSGKYALVAQKFFADYQTCDRNSAVVKGMKTAESVLAAYCPVNWNNLIEECDLDEVNKYAKRMYKNSGINDVMDAVLKTVVSQVVKRCIESAIELCMRTSRNLITSVDFRLNGLKLLENQLLQEINDLENDLNDLKEIKAKQLFVMQELSESLRNELTSIFNEALTKCEEVLKIVFNPDNEDWYEKNEKIRMKLEEQLESKATIGATVLGSVAGLCVLQSAVSKGGISIGAIVGGIFGWSIIQEIIKFVRGTQEEIRFDSEDDANAFIEKIAAVVNKVLNEVYTTVEHRISDACNQSCQQFNCQINGQLMNILRRANERLNKTFDLNITPPKKLEANLKEIDLDVQDIGHAQPYHPSRIFRLLTRKQTDNKTTWFLSRKIIQEKCFENMKKNMEHIQTDIVENVYNEISTNFNSLYTNLQEFLREYEGHAKTCLSDKNLTKENQEYLKNNLQNFKMTLSIKEKEINEFYEQIDWNKLM